MSMLRKSAIEFGASFSRYQPVSSVFLRHYDSPLPSPEEKKTNPSLINRLFVMEEEGSYEQW